MKKIWKFEAPWIGKITQLLQKLAKTVKNNGIIRNQTRYLKTRERPTLCDTPWGDGGSVWGVCFGDTFGGHIKMIWKPEIIGGGRNETHMRPQNRPPKQLRRRPLGCPLGCPLGVPWGVPWGVSQGVSPGGSPGGPGRSLGRSWGSTSWGYPRGTPGGILGCSSKAP
jgi:hypothetical protein